jgi:hypothetical protein
MFMKQSNGKCRTKQKAGDFIGEIDYLCLATAQSLQRNKMQHCILKCDPCGIDYTEIQNKPYK